MVQFSVEDLRSVESLERVLRQFQAALESARSLKPQPANPPIQALVERLAPMLRDQLQATGLAPLNLQSLLPSSVASSFVEDTHANRLSNYPASDYAVGTGFIETDRTVAYVVTNSGGTLVWTYYFGVYRDTFANRPVDLGTNDTGFRFAATDTAQHFRWTGATPWVEEYEVKDAVTAPPTTILNLIHRRTAGAVAGFGAALAYLLDSSANTLRNAGYVDIAWASPTDGAETADLVVRLMLSGGSPVEVFRIKGTAEVVCTLKDAVTAAITLVQDLLHRSSGVPAAGFGVGLNFQLDSSTNTIRSAGDVDVVWATATDSLEDADLVVRLMAAGAVAAERFRITSAGNPRIAGRITLYNNAAPADGQLLIGNTGGARFDAATLTGTANRVTVTNGAGTITLTTPQNTHTGASPIFAGLTITSNVTFTATTTGFFGAAAVAQQTSGANLTNNVAAGGTTDQIDNFTDLATYANDAAAIRNDIYQLARKLKQVNDALRAYGLLT